MYNVFSVILDLLILHVMPCLPWPGLPFTTDQRILKILWPSSQATKYHDSLILCLDNFEQNGKMLN